MTPGRPRTDSPDRLRVLFVNTSKGSPLGAGPWVHSQIMAHLDPERHEVHVACATRADPDAPMPLQRLVEPLPNVEVHGVDFGPERIGQSLRGSWSTRLAAIGGLFAAVASFVRLLWFVRRAKIDIIHTDERPRDAFASLLLARLSRARCVIHMHVDFADWLTPLQQWSIRRAHALMAVSGYVESTLLDAGPLAGRIWVVHNGIDLAAWTPGQARREAREMLELDDGTVLVITVCRVIPGKGVDDMIRALAEARGAGSDARLLVVGGSQDIAAGFQEQLHELVAELALDDVVTFAGRRDDVARLLAAADVFGMPSVGEPFGLAYLEAMAMHLPVVALDDGGAPEVIDDGVTGLLSKRGDTAGLAGNLDELLRDAARRERFGAAGRRRVAEQFTVQRMADRVDAVYREILGGVR
jgi:glycosyltransferase involved in cell wall biosynthesis